MPRADCSLPRWGAALQQRKSQKLVVSLSLFVESGSVFREVLPDDGGQLALDGEEGDGRGKNKSEK